MASLTLGKCVNWICATYIIYKGTFIFSHDQTCTGKELFSLWEEVIDRPIIPYWPEPFRPIISYWPELFRSIIDIGSVDHFDDFWIQKSHHFYDFWIQKYLHFYDFWIQKYNLSIFWGLESEKWYVNNYISFCSCWFFVFDNKWHPNRKKNMTIQKL